MHISPSPDVSPSPAARRCRSVIAVAVTLLAGLVAASFPAQAQNYPWCLISTAYDGAENCGFTTYEQCLVSRQGIGGFCQVNTMYRPNVAPAPPRRVTRAYAGKPY